MQVVAVYDKLVDRAKCSPPAGTSARNPSPFSVQLPANNTMRKSVVAFVLSLALPMIGGNSSMFSSPLQRRVAEYYPRMAIFYTCQKRDNLQSPFNITKAQDLLRQAHWTVRKVRGTPRLNGM